jgi:hypothetical protein
MIDQIKNSIEIAILKELGWLNVTNLDRTEYTGVRAEVASVTDREEAFEFTFKFAVTNRGLKRLGG